MIKQHKAAGFVNVTGSNLTRRQTFQSEAKNTQYPTGTPISLKAMIPTRRATVVEANVNASQNDMGRSDQIITMSNHGIKSNQKYNLLKPKSINGANVLVTNRIAAQRGGYQHFPQINRTSTMMMTAQLAPEVVETPTKPLQTDTTTYDVSIYDNQKSTAIFEQGWIVVKYMMAKDLEELKSDSSKIEPLVSQIADKEKSFVMHEAKEYLDECLTAYLEAIVIKLSQTEGVENEDVANRTRNYFFEDLDTYFNMFYYPPTESLPQITVSQLEKLDSIKYSEKARDMVRGKFQKGDQITISATVGDEKGSPFDINLVHEFAQILIKNDYGIPKGMTPEIFTQTLVQSFDEICDRIQSKGIKDTEQTDILNQDYWDEKIMATFSETGNELRKVEEKEEITV